MLYGHQQCGVRRCYAGDEIDMGIAQSGSSLFFFFFQAEDGIRDWSVTGVQTCALPISGKRRIIGRVVELAREVGADELSRSVVRDLARDAVLADVRGEDGVGGAGDHRSEERRVGKECRSRWSPYH